MKILRWKHTKKHFYDSVKRDRIPHAMRVGRAILFDSTEIRKLATRNRLSRMGETHRV